MIKLGKGMPDFDSRGNLPPKCWEVTLDDIKEHLVDNFPYSTTRSSRFQCFLRFLNLPDLFRGRGFANLKT